MTEKVWIGLWTMWMSFRFHAGIHVLTFCDNVSTLNLTPNSCGFSQLQCRKTKPHFFFLSRLLMIHTRSLEEPPFIFILKKNKEVWQDRQWSRSFVTHPPLSGDGKKKPVDIETGCRHNNSDRQTRRKQFGLCWLSRHAKVEEDEQGKWPSHIKQTRMNS